MVRVIVAIEAGGQWVVPGNRWDLLPPPVEPPHVTAVVLHYRDPQRLALVLAALDLQTHPRSRLQIVVADDGSAPLPVVPPDVTMVSQDDRGFRAAAARNLGAAAATGDVVCFLDGDTVPEPGYVAAAAALPAVCADVLVVGRRRHADLTGWTPDRLRTWFRGGPAPRELTEPCWLRDAYRDSRDLLDVDGRSYRFVISAVLSCHRDLLAATGGFDETFTGYGGEDWEFAHRAYTAGAVLAHRRDAVAWHDGPDWGEREGGTPTGDAQKARETAALAERIPDPASRGPAFHAAAPGLLAEMSGGSVAAQEASVRSLLAACEDVLVVVESEVAARLGDPRVMTGPVDCSILQRIPYRVSATAPVRWNGIDALLDQADRAGAGQMVTADGVVTVTAARAANRSARHDITLDRLFPVLTTPALPRATP